MRDPELGHGFGRSTEVVSRNTVTQDNVVALWQRRDAMINPIVSDFIRYWEGLRQGAAAQAAEVVLELLPG